MSFNKGDKVRIVGSATLDEKWNGVEGVITEIVSGAPWPIRVGQFTTEPEIDDNVGYVFLNPLEVELIEEEPEPEPAPVVDIDQARQRKDQVGSATVAGGASLEATEIRDYLRDIILVYRLMEGMNRASGSEYPANIYKAVINEITNLEKMVEKYIKQHD